MDILPALFIFITCMALVKQTSYTSKSILSILQSNHLPLQSKSVPITYLIPSSSFILLSLISLWALPFYVVLGLCYYFHSGILVEDLQTDRLRSQWDLNSFHDELTQQYRQLTSHCFLAATLYLFVLLICSGILHFRSIHSDTHPNRK